MPSKRDIEEGVTVPLNGKKKTKQKESNAKSSGPFKLSVVPPLSVFLNPLSWLLWVLDFLVYLIVFCLPIKSCLWSCKRCCKQDSVANPEEDEEEDEFARRRRRDLWDDEDGLFEGPEGKAVDGTLSNVWAIVSDACDAFGDNPCMGTREFLGMKKPEGAQFPSKVFGETTWQSYDEVKERALCFGSGLRELGLQPLPAGMSFEQVQGPHSILIFEDTCAEWMTALVGASSQSIITATSYATLGVQAVVDAITECNVNAVVCNKKKALELGKIAPPCLKHIIYTHRECDVTQQAEALPAASGVQFIYYEHVIGLGRQALPRHPVCEPPTESLAVIMYTSGSTGKPKGVMITHANIAASVSCLEDALCPPLSQGEETYLAYLPAAHILELCAELAMLSLGAAIGFADVRSLVSNVIRQCPDGTENDQPTYPYPPGAVMEFRPTCMVGVPLIWDTIKKGVEDKVGKQGCIAGWIVQTAFSGRAFGHNHGRATPLMNLLLKKLYNNFGGRMKLGITGGGPISADVQQFISVAMGFPLIQGYALTETTCAGTVQKFDDPDCGAVGGPVSSVEIKLRSCTGPEDPKDRQGKKYKATDKKHCGVPCQGRGEVCIRGPSVSRGYFKQPQKTAEAWDEDEWFHSGDIGIWDSRGRLCIVDRLKNLIKLKGGEYISVESMEKEYGTSVYVRGGADGGIMCYGDGEMKKPVALLQVNVPELKKWAASKGRVESNVEEICDSEEAKKEVLKSLLEAGKPGDKSGCKLGANESLASVLLLTNGWTPENGGKTASNKLDRAKIKEMHKDKFEELRQRGT